MKKTGEDNADVTVEHTHTGCPICGKFTKHTHKWGEWRRKVLGDRD